MAQNSSSPAVGSNPLLVLVYWAIVAVPLSWGVYKTVQKSVPLFSGAAAVATTTAPQASATPAMLTPAPAPTTPSAIAPALEVAPPPTASPFSTAQPSETVAPIVTPAPPTT